MILDPYIIKACSSVTVEQLREAFNRLYTKTDNPSHDLQPMTAKDDLLIRNWLKKLRAGKPGLALSVSRRGSDKGILTCCLLSVLGIANPKAARSRMELAWTIIDSPLGEKAIGNDPALNVELQRAIELGFLGKMAVFEETTE